MNFKFYLLIPMFCLVLSGALVCACMNIFDRVGRVIPFLCLHVAFLRCRIMRNIRVLVTYMGISSSLRVLNADMPLVAIKIIFRQFCNWSRSYSVNDCPMDNQGVCEQCVS